MMPESTYTQKRKEKLGAVRLIIQQAIQNAMARCATEALETVTFNGAMTYGCSNAQPQRPTVGRRSTLAWNQWTERIFIVWFPHRTYAVLCAATNVEFCRKAIALFDGEILIVLRRHFPRLRSSHTQVTCYTGTSAAFSLLLGVIKRNLTFRMEVLRAQT